MQLTDLPKAGIAFVIIAVVLSVGATIITSLGASDTSDASKNITEDSKSGIATLAGWLPTIALVVAAAVVLGSLMTYFAFKE